MKPLSATVALTALSTALASASVISINFTEGLKNQQIPSSVTAGNTRSTNWNNLSGKEGKHTVFLDNTGKSHSFDLTWKAPGTWGDEEAKGDAEKSVGNAILVLGYLDDNSQANSQIQIPNPPYKHYTVILYFSTDSPGGKYGSPSVNGITHQMAPNKRRYRLPFHFNATNSLTVRNLKGPLTITLPPRDHSTRSSIAGFQLIETKPVLLKSPSNTLINTGSFSINLKYLE